MFSFGTVAPHAHCASSLSPFPFSIDASKYLGFYLQVSVISPSSWFHKPLPSLMVVVVSKCLTTCVNLCAPLSPRDTGPLTFTLGHAVLDSSSGVLHILIVFYFENSSFFFEPFFFILAIILSKAVIRSSLDFFFRGFSSSSSFCEFSGVIRLREVLEMTGFGAVQVY